MNVDIISPIYKPNLKFLYEAIDSVLEQTYENWQLIIIDDGSGDSSLAKIQERYGSHNSKIRYIKLNKNIRVAGARNYAISRSTGDLIVFIDQDDVWHKDKLYEYIKYFNKHPDIKLIHSNISAIDKNSNIIPGYFHKENIIRNQIPYSNMDKKVLAENLFKYYSIRLGTLCIKRKCFLKSGGFDSNLFGGEDEEFIVRFAYNYKIDHISKILTYRRMYKRNSTKIYRNIRRNGKLEAIKKMWKIYDFKYSKNKYIYQVRSILLNNPLSKTQCIKYLKELFITESLDFKNSLLIFLRLLNFDKSYLYKINSFVKQ